MVIKWERTWREKLGVWDYHMQTTVSKIDKQQGPTENTGSYIQYLVITYNGREYICLYMDI